jgi:hypothetical protein
MGDIVRLKINLSLPCSVVALIISALFIKPFLSRPADVPKGVIQCCDTMVQEDHFL